MPSNCAVFGCFSNRKKPGCGDISFFGFPKNEEYRRKWVQICRRADNINDKYARVCSLHFEPSAYERNLKYELLGTPLPRKLARLKEDALPTLHLPTAAGELTYSLFIKEIYFN